MLLHTPALLGAVPVRIPAAQHARMHAFVSTLKRVQQNVCPCKLWACVLFASLRPRAASRNAQRRSAPVLSQCQDNNEPTTKRTCQQQKSLRLHAAGFEPAQPKLWVLETHPLDHSGTRAGETADEASEACFVLTRLQLLVIIMS